MSTAKVAITFDQDLLNHLDRLVRSLELHNRSRAIQEAVSEKSARMESGRLARECSKLDAMHSRVDRVSAHAIPEL